MIVRFEWDPRRCTVENDAARIPVQFTLTALVYPESEVGGYSAQVPALPGCYTQGETLEEIQANLREAAEGWLASAHDEATKGVG
jgi:predicted RNase H-like HicB family nuclease